MDRTRTRLAIAASVLIAAFTAACGSAAPDTGGGASAGPTSVSITLSEFKIEPSMIHVPTGSDLRFEVANAGTTDHTFGVMTADGLVVTDTIPAGGAATLDVAPLDEGTYDILCSVSGHADAGMKGSLIVSADQAAGAVSGESASGSVSGAMAMGDGMTVQQMLDGHASGVKAFPAPTQGTGNQPLEPIVENGWKVFRLTATQVKWETKPGVFVDAMAYNGQIPGPELRVSPGDKVRVVVENQMTEPTVMHFHGLTVPNAMDGVPYITQDPIMPGGFFTYEFTIVDPPGMYVYHSHFNSTEQVGMGLYGPLIVVPSDGTWDYPSVTWDASGALTFGPPAVIAAEYTVFLGDGPLGYVLNAKEFPATAPMVAQSGDWVLIHMANDGSMLHPMHLHGLHFLVVSMDGFPLEQPYEADTLVVAPGQRFDVLVHADQPGAWAFHCHILPHVEGPEGMYGMVTALVVQ